MKRDFSTELRTIDGAFILQGPLDPSTVGAALTTLDRETQEKVKVAFAAYSIRPLTVGGAASAALGGAFPDEKGKLPDDERNRRWKLALQIVEGGEHEITAEQSSVIKKVVSKAYEGAVISPQVHIFLGEE